MFFKNLFHGGIHPREVLGGKSTTRHLPIEVAPPPATVTISMIHGVGNPALPLVKVGEIVSLGQKIGEASGPISASVHASVSGKVKAVEVRTAATGVPGAVIVIENDGQDRLDASVVPCEDPLALGPAEIAARVRQAGIVGLGGAAFPTDVKLSPPKDKPVEMVLLNGAECEPYLTGDHRVMLENTAAVVMGLKLCMRAVGAARGVIAVEDNKPDAIEALKSAVGSQPGIEVKSLPTIYPQGGEKQLIQAITGRQVPSGGLPADVGVIVVNVATAAQISASLTTGMPLISRVITVTGQVRNPKNLRVCIGDSVGRMLDLAGGALPDSEKVVLGGPMTGLSLFELDMPVLKSTTAVLVMHASHSAQSPQSNCIRCCHCQNSCPSGLMPMQLDAMVNHDRFAQAKEAHAPDCIECGICTYVCPAHRQLTQSIRVAKREIQKRKL